MCVCLTFITLETDSVVGTQSRKLSLNSDRNCRSTKHVPKKNNDYDRFLFLFYTQFDLKITLTAAQVAQVVLLRRQGRTQWKMVETLSAPRTSERYA